MTDPIRPVTKSKLSFKTKFIIAENVLIYTATIAVGAFYLGAQYNEHQTADRQAAIHDALKAAATPAAVAKAAPEK